MNTAAILDRARTMPAAFERHATIRGWFERCYSRGACQRIRAMREAAVGQSAGTATG